MSSKEYYGLLASEIIEPNRPPEYRLWAAVLARAVADYYYGLVHAPKGLGGISLTAYITARDWIFGGDKCEYSYNWVCYILDKEPDKVLDKIISTGKDMAAGNHPQAGRPLLSTKYGRFY